MTFFKQLTEIAPGLDLTIKIKAIDGNLTVSIVPDIGNKGPLQPLNLTGTAEEIDEGFFVAVTPPLHDAGLIISNAEGFKTSVKEAVETPPAKSKAKPKKKAENPAKKKAAPPKKKVVEKKATPVKPKKEKVAPAAKVKKEKKKPEPKPSVVEPSMFDAPVESPVKTEAAAETAKDENDTASPI